MQVRNRYLSRQELYQLVWSEPIAVVAKLLGMSDVGLAKACRRASVPVPERGYWAKRKAGKPTIKPPLSPRGLGMSDQTTVMVTVSSEPNAGEPFNAPALSLPTFAEDIETVTARVREMVGKVTIPKTLAKSHPVIGQLLDDDERRREEQKKSPYPSIWNKPLYDSPTERRRLRILNAVFLALARCDMRPSIDDRDKTRQCEVQVGSQQVYFVLEAIVSRARRGQTEPMKKKGPPERLRLSIRAWERNTDFWKSWTDSDDASIEARIDEIVVNLIVAGEAQYRWRLQHHYEWQLKMKQLEEEEERRKKEEEERRERERLIKEQKARVDRLLGEATALRQAADIRTYVKTVLETHAPVSKPAVQQKLQDWAEWALAEADRLDPVKSGRFLTANESTATI